ncbi:hypothetical protein [Amycolatopsis sp. lyj-109]|uniref:WXG100-like domain-containing protein n=1 Tax=Amycolatopsis sp. lyj-109 TaxID=2789287 RepID=UPI00397ACAD7
MVTKETGGSAHGGGEASSAHGKGAALSHHVSEQLQTFCKVIVGMAFPEGDHNALYAMADAWEDFRHSLEAINAGMEKLVPQFERSMHGATAERNLKYLTTVRDGLRAEQDKAQEYAKMCRTAAADIVKTIIMFAVMLAMVLATIIALAISVFGSFAIPGTVAAGRVALTQMWNALVRSISQLTLRQVGMAVGKIAWTMGKYAAINAGLMTGLDITIQGFQKLDHKRDDIDLDSLKNSAIGGAIGGAAFGAVRGAAKVGLGMIGEDVGKRAPGWVRGTGQIGYAATQVLGVMPSNALVNLATGGHGEFWAGALGAAAHYNTVKPTSLSAKLDDAMWKSVHGDFSWVPRPGDARGPALDADLAGGSHSVSPEISEVERTGLQQAFSDVHAAVSSALDAPLFPGANARAMRGETAGEGSAEIGGETGKGAPEVMTGDGAKLGRLFVGQDKTSVEPNSTGDQRSGTTNSGESRSSDTGTSSGLNTGRPAEAGLTQDRTVAASADDGGTASSSADGTTSGRPQLSVDTSSAERFLTGTSADSTSSVTTSNSGSARSSWAGSATDTPSSPASTVDSLQDSAAMHPLAGHRPGATTLNPVAEGSRADNGASASVPPKATSSASPAREIPATTEGTRTTSASPSGGEPTGTRTQPKIDATGPDSTSRTVPEPEVRQPATAAKTSAGPAVAQPSAAGSAPARPLSGGEPASRTPASSRVDAEQVGSGRAASPVEPRPVSGRPLPVSDTPGPRPAETSAPRSTEPGPARSAPQPDTEGKSGVRAPDPAAVKAAASGVTSAPAPRAATGEGTRASGTDPVVTGAPADRGGPTSGPHRSGTPTPLHDGPTQKPAAGGRPEKLMVSPPDRLAGSSGPDRPQPEQSPRTDKFSPSRSRTADDAAAATVAAAYLAPMHETEAARVAQPVAGPDVPGMLPKDGGWQQQRDASTPTRFSSRQLERAPGSDSATIVQVRYDVRHFEVRPGKWVLEFSVPLDVVSRGEAVPAAARRDGAQRLQRHLDSEFNHRFHWEAAGRWNGSQVHFTVEADTPSRVEPGWDSSPDRNVPVEMHVPDSPDRDGGKGGSKPAQTRWNLYDPVTVHTDQYLRFLGLPTQEPDGSPRSRRAVEQLAGREVELGGAVLSHSLHDTGRDVSQAQEYDGSRNSGTDTYSDGPKPRNPTPIDPPPGADGTPPSPGGKGKAIADQKTLLGGSGSKHDRILSTPEHEMLYHNVRRKLRDLTYSGVDPDFISLVVTRESVLRAYKQLDGGGWNNLHDAAELIAGILAGTKAKLRGGAVGFEAELHGVGIHLDSGMTSGEAGNLVEHAVFDIAADNGINNADIIEYVSKPIYAVEGDEGRVDFDTALNVFDQVLRRLKKWGRLESVFSDEGLPGSKVDPLADDYRTYSIPETDHIYPQYTVGVPVLGLRRFLGELVDRNRVGAGPIRAAHDHLVAALRVADSFAEGQLLSEVDKAAFSGVVTLSLIQAAAMAHQVAFGAANGMTKNNVAAASRVSLDAVRRELTNQSAFVSEVLDREADAIVQRFTDLTNLDFDKKIPPPWRGAEPAEGKILDYVNSGLQSKPGRRYNQSETLGVRTNFDELDTNPDPSGRARLTLPLVLLELRLFGQEAPAGPRYIRDRLKELVDLSREIYAMARSLAGIPESSSTSAVNRSTGRAVSAPAKPELTAGRFQELPTIREVDEPAGDAPADAGREREGRGDLREEGDSIGRESSELATPDSIMKRAADIRESGMTESPAFARVLGRAQTMILREHDPVLLHEKSARYADGLPESERRLPGVRRGLLDAVSVVVAEDFLRHGELSRARELVRDIAEELGTARSEAMLRGAAGPAPDSRPGVGYSSGHTPGDTGGEALTRDSIIERASGIRDGAARARDSGAERSDGWSGAHSRAEEIAVVRGRAALVRASARETSAGWEPAELRVRSLLREAGGEVAATGSDLWGDVLLVLTAELFDHGDLDSTRAMVRGFVNTLGVQGAERGLSTDAGQRGLVPIRRHEDAATAADDASLVQPAVFTDTGSRLSEMPDARVAEQPRPSNAGASGELVGQAKTGDDGGTPQARDDDPAREPSQATPDDRGDILADRGAGSRPGAAGELPEVPVLSESLLPEMLSEVNARLSGPEEQVTDGEAPQTQPEVYSGVTRTGRGSAWKPSLAAIPEGGEPGRRTEDEGNTPATDGLPSEHRDGTFGAARQLYRTQGFEEIWRRLRSMSERAASQAELEKFSYEVGNDLRSFQGGSKVVDFAGKQFILEPELDWSRQSPVPGTAAVHSAEHSSSSGSAARTLGGRAPKMTWKVFNPMVPGLFGTGGITVPTGPATSRSHGHEVSRTSQLKLSLDGAVDAEAVSVPVSVRITELDDHGYPTGRTEQVGGDVTTANPLAVVVSMPVGLRSTGEGVPVPRSLPPAFVEQATVQTTPGYRRGKPSALERVHGWGVSEQVLGLVGKLGTESQKELRAFVSDANIEAKLPEMAVSPEDAARGKGWVTSEALSRGGNPVKHLLSTRVRKVEMRAVAREVTYLEHVGKAKFEEERSESAGRSASATVDRSVNAAYAAGPGYDVGAMSAGAGPHAEGERGRSHTQTYERADAGTSSRTYEGTVVRYRTVYDLEVRPSGQPPMTFSHALDAVHWAKSEDAERAGIHPGNEGASPAGTTPEVLSPVKAAESAAPGAALALADASDLLSGVLRDSAKEIPGHHRWAWRDSTFIGDFGDSKLARGLSSRHERQLGRGEEIDRALSPESLAQRAPNLLTDQPLTVELTPEHGRAHDYHAAFRIDASLEGGLVDLGLADGETGPAKLSSDEAGGRQQATHWSLGVGVLARVYTSLTGSSGILTSAHKVTRSRSRGAGYEEGTTLTAGGTRGTGLDETGKVRPERVRRYEATVKLTVTGTHWSRHNELVRGVTVGRRGLDVPPEHQLKIVDESAEAQGREPGTVRVKVVLELPESHPLPGFEVKPARTTELPEVSPNTIRNAGGTSSRVSDGIRLVGMSGLGFVRQSIRSMLVKASGDPIFASRDGSNSALIDQTISVESARNDLRLFNRPIQVRGLQWKERRRANVVANVVVTHQLRDPVVLATVWEEPEIGITSSSRASHDISSSWTVTNSVEAVYLPISAGSLHGPGTKIHGMGALLHELSYWVSTFGRKAGHSTTVSNTQTVKGEPRKLYLVQANVETTVAVETRRHGNIDRWQLAELFPRVVPDRWRSAGEVRRAAERLELPEAARVLVTEAQLRDIEIQQAKVDAERASAPPHEPGPEEPSGPTDLVPIPPGRELGGGPWSDGVIEPVDLIDAAAEKGRDLFAELHARVTQRLGKDVADRLLPDSSLATEHDNLQEVQRYLSNFQGFLPDLANGGTRTTLRLEDRLRGKTYELRVDAKAPETPRPAGIRHGELTKTSKVAVTTTEARGVKRVLAEFTTLLIPAIMLQSAAAEETSHTPGQRHGAPYAALGLGPTHVFEWLQQSRETGNAEANEREHRETVRGALAERHLDVDFDVAIERHGERIAETKVTARVTGTSIVEDRAAAPEGPVRGEVVKHEAADATDAGMADWYEARDAEALPADPAQYRITGFDGSRDDLVEGARQALVESGFKPDHRTLGLLRDLLAPSRIEKLGGLPGRAGVELELPPELGAKLKLHSTTRGTGQLTGASARIALGGGTEATRSTHVENGHDSANTVFATPLIAAGVPQAPEHATYAQGREPFGTIAHWGIPMEVLGARADGHEHGHSTKSGGAELPEGKKPERTENAAPAEALTGTWSYPTDFRFVAEPTSKLSLKSPAVVDVSFPKGYHIRRADRTDLIPDEVAHRARDLAQRDREWSAARDLVRAEEAAARNKTPASEESGLSGDRLDEVRDAAAHAEANWWRAAEAYQAAWTGAGPNVRVVFGADAKTASPAQRVDLRRFAKNIMREHLRGTDPKIRYRVTGKHEPSAEQLTSIGTELSTALNRIQLHVPVQDRLDLEQFGGTRDASFIDSAEPTVVDIWLEKSLDTPEQHGTPEPSRSTGEPAAGRDSGAGTDTGRSGEPAAQARTGDDGGTPRTRDDSLSTPDHRGALVERHQVTPAPRRVEVLNDDDPSSSATDVVRTSDVVFVPLTHKGAISGVLFPRPGEASVVQKAFKRTEEDLDAYATVLHHDENGFSVWLRSGEQVVISEKSVFRLMTGGGLLGGDLWRQWRRQLLLACLVDDPSLADSAGRTPLDRFRGLLRDDGYAGDVQGPSVHVSVREDGRFTQHVGKTPDWGNDELRLAELFDGVRRAGDGRDARHPVEPATKIVHRGDRTDTAGKLRDEAADPVLRSVTLRPPRREEAAEFTETSGEVPGVGRTSEPRTAPESPRPATSGLVDIGAHEGRESTTSGPFFLRETETLAGGIVFADGSGAVDMEQVSRVHAGMPAGTDGEKSMNVYVMSRSGRFLVDGSLIDGPELANRVRGRSEFAALPAGTLMTLVLLGKDSDPAFERGLIDEAGKFAGELRDDGPRRSVRMTTTAVLDTANESDAGHAREFRMLPDVMPEDVDWIALIGSNGRFGMGFGTLKPLVTDKSFRRWHKLIDDHTLRIVAESMTLANGETIRHYAVQDWAAATDGDRTRPFRMMLTADGKEFHVPLKNGKSIAVSPEEMAALIAGSASFRHAFGGPVRPELIVITHDPENPDKEANLRMLTKLQDLMGPFVSYSYSGKISFDEHGVLEIPRGDRFVEGPSPRLGFIRHQRSGLAFDFTAKGSDSGILTAAGAIQVATRSGDDPPTLRFADVSEHRDPLVFKVDSPDGKHVTVTVWGFSDEMSPAFEQRLELGGRQLGEMLLADPEILRLLREDPQRPVVLVAAKGGERVNFGGLGFDVAGALRRETIFNDVYAQTDDGGVTGSPRFELVSVLRAGDLQIELLKGRHGIPIALWVGHHGDGEHFLNASSWARNADESQERSAYVFVSPEYAAIRSDGVDLRLTVPELGQVLRNEPALQRLLGDDRDRPLAIFPTDGKLSYVLSEMSPELLRGGYSRLLAQPKGVVSFKGGRLNFEVPGLEIKSPPLPSPGRVFSFAYRNPELGDFGQLFPRDLADSVGRSAFGRNLTPISQRVYFRRLEGLTKSGKPVTRLIPALVPKSGPGITSLKQQWLVEGHGNERGLTFGLGGDRPFHIGDSVKLSGADSAVIVKGSEAYRRAAKSTGVVRLINCKVNTAIDDEAEPPATAFREAWNEEGKSIQVIGSTEIVQPGMFDDKSVIMVKNGGVFAEARSAGEGVDWANVVHLQDLAAEQIEPVIVSFARDGERDVTILGDAGEQVTDLVRQTVRAAAWRHRIGAPLPEVWVGVEFGGGHDVEGRRLEEVLALVEREVAAESRLMAELGLAIGPEEISVLPIELESSPAESAPENGLPPVRLLVELPKSPEIEEAQAVLQYARNFSRHNDSSVFEKVFDAFAALEAGPAMRAGSEDRLEPRAVADGDEPVTRG